MNKILPALFIISTLIVYSSCQVGESVEEAFPGFILEEGKLYEVRGTEPYTGELKDHYDDGTLKMKSVFHEGVRKSTIHYYGNGQKQSSYIMKEDGWEMTNWYTSGQKQDEFLPGIIREWYENGRLKAEVEMNDFKEYDGTMKMWDEEGILIVHEIYENGDLVETIQQQE